jgi:hypothetical protein
MLPFCEAFILERYRILSDDIVLIEVKRLCSQSTKGNNAVLALEKVNAKKGINAGGFDLRPPPRESVWSS